MRGERVEWNGSVCYLDGFSLFGLSLRIVMDLQATGAYWVNTLDMDYCSSKDSIYTERTLGRGLSWELCVIVKIIGFL